MKKIVLLLLAGQPFFTKAQNVGIGTTNPSRAKLEVHGAVDATSAIFGGESSGISLQRAWPGIGFNTYFNGTHKYMSNGYGGVLALDPANGYLVLDMFASGTANNNVIFPYRAMVINNLGWINVGSAKAPTATLQVARGSAADGTAIFEGTNHASYFNNGPDENTYIRAGRNFGQVILNDIPGGRTSVYGPLGINTTGFAYPLEIQQTDQGRGLLLRRPGYSDRWGLSFDGDATLQLQFNSGFKGSFSYATGNYSSVSDRRLKTAIQPLPPLLAKLMQLRPVAYEMIADSSSHEKTIGFIAQDVEPLFPELVSLVKGTTHGYKGIADLHTLNYSGFGVLAVKAIQEQQYLIERQQETLQKQERLIGELKEAVQKGEAEVKEIKKILADLRN